MEKIRIIDKRTKEKFIIDDEYLNGWAKKCGIYATGVYVSLCRHANKEQKCWPSLDKIAEELSISKMSVRRGLDELEKRNIVKKERMGKKLSNRYYLIDKSEWSDRTVSECSDRTVCGLPQNTHCTTTEHSIVRKHKKGNTRKETQKKRLSSRMVKTLEKEMGLSSPDGDYEMDNLFPARSVAKLIRKEAKKDNEPELTDDLILERFTKLLLRMNNFHRQNATSINYIKRNFNKILNTLK